MNWVTLKGATLAFKNWLLGPSFARILSLPGVVAEARMRPKQDEPRSEFEADLKPRKFCDCFQVVFEVSEDKHGRN